MRRVVADQPVFLSTVPARRSDWRLAVAVIVVSLLILAALAPFAQVPLPPVGAFVPIYQSALVLSDLTTAAILIIQLNILRSPALLALACGYLFTALMAVCHLLTFPGLFAPGGLLGAGPQSTAWLYVFWHGGFPIAVVCYALLKGRPDTTGSAGFGHWLLPLSIGAVVLAVCGLTLLATAGKALLPDVMTAGKNNNIVLAIAVGADLALTFAALGMLRLRRLNTLLDVWLMVVMCAWLCDVTLSALLNNQRFDLGYYAGRIYGFLAASFVLVVLLQETGALYAQLVELFTTEQQERRREAEERRRLFETSLDLIFVTDSRGNLLRVSPSSRATLGYAPDEMVGRSAVEFIYAGDLEQTRSEMRLARRGKQMRNFATRYVRKDGTVVTLDWSGVWSEPEQRHFFIGRDVTEQKRIERMKDEFIATVSHELRTPVTSIAGPLGLLMGGAAGELPEPVNRLVAMAHSNSERLAQLVRDLLDLDRIESGAMAFSLRQVEVKPLVEQAIEVNRPLAEKFGVPVHLRGDGAGLSVRTDRDRLMQVVANLLSNAVKFSPRGTDVSVSIERRQTDVRIAVRDHGPGVPDDFKALMFEKFAQVEATNARRKGGIGIGLSIVRQTMMRLGGSVGYTAAPSGGSVFHVDVPRWDAQVPADAA